MLTKIYGKVRCFFPFLIKFLREKPSAQGDWRWVIENSNCSDLDREEREYLEDCRQTYIPQQLHYFGDKIPSKSSTAKNKTNTWEVDNLINLSNIIAKAYYPGCPDVPTSNKDGLN